MRIPIVQGVIDRRILINFRVEPEILARLLPSPFRPKLVAGYGVAGVCLIRLKQVRPRFLPAACGLASENAAHRIAVVWGQDGHEREGVFIPRRDTSSRWNALAGGRVFPGMHHHARFRVRETGASYRVCLDSDDGETHLVVEGREVSEFPESSLFGSLAEASDFFRAGSLGYSVTIQPGRYDGLELRSFGWQAQPLAIERVESSFFDDRSRFPTGSAQFDSALLMRGIDHEWHGRAPLFAGCDV